AKQGEVELRRVGVKISGDNLAFCHLRAAQGNWRVAPFRWQAAYSLSGTCALRRAYGTARSISFWENQGIVRRE
ncbi:hypothetical protein A2U01_0055213, partial [Trifolium medium]|nr:hypothetical protein [Trifolium medium]